MPNTNLEKRQKEMFKAYLKQSQSINKVLSYILISNIISKHPFHEYQGNF